MKKLKYSIRKKIQFLYLGECMNQIEGISISDLSYDKVCLNCKFWMVSGMNSSFVLCTQGNGLTNPDDTCPMFIHQNSLDDDYNAYILKSYKMSVWQSQF